MHRPRRALGVVPAGLRRRTRSRGDGDRPDDVERAADHALLRAAGRRRRPALDTDGTIAASVANWQRWFVSQRSAEGFGSTPREASSTCRSLELGPGPETSQHRAGRGSAAPVVAAGSSRVVSVPDGASRACWSAPAPRRRAEATSPVRCAVAPCRTAPGSRLVQAGTRQPAPRKRRLSSGLTMDRASSIVVASARRRCDRARRSSPEAWTYGCASSRRAHPRLVDAAVDSAGAPTRSALPGALADREAADPRRAPSHRRRPGPRAHRAGLRGRTRPAARRRPALPRRRPRPCHPAVFRAQPLTPVAIGADDAPVAKNTPWTSPWTTTRRRIIGSRTMPSGSISTSTRSPARGCVDRRDGGFERPPVVEPDAQPTRPARRARPLDDAVPVARRGAARAPPRAARSRRPRCLRGRGSARRPRRRGCAQSSSGRPDLHDPPGPHRRRRGRRA